MRLIDADKLTIDCYAQGQDGTVPAVTTEQIDEAPTVEERRHGHWIEDKHGDIKCSNCDRYLYPVGVRIQPIADICRKLKTDYCPKCGAIMDESKDILQLKTEDVVKVVRCKDCKFYHRGKPYHCDKVSYFESGVNDMFYCAWGEKNG